MRVFANQVYLDYNATAPVRPEVIATMAETLAEVGNPSSVHGSGRAARRRIEQARALVAALVGADPDNVIFTSGGTEANNQALAAVGGGVMTSAIEHDSVLRAADGFPRLDVDASGWIDLPAAGAAMDAHRPAMLAVMLANNETGVIQPVRALAAIARERGMLVHCDAVQAAGKVAVDIADLGVDSLSLSAHKLGGPQGVGALVVSGGLEPRPFLKGGAQERRLRAGTENVAGIVGFGEAAKLAMADRSFTPRVGALRDHLEAAVRARAPAARVFGVAAPRLPNTSCLTMPGVSQETQLIAFDLAGVAVSSGSACSSGKVGASHVLAAMGVPLGDAHTAIRVSLGWNSQMADVDRFVECYGALFARHIARLQRPIADSTSGTTAGCG